MIQFDEHIFQMGWFNHQLDWGYTHHNDPSLGTISCDTNSCRKDRQGFEDEITGYLNMVNKLGSHKSQRHQDMVGHKL